MSVGYKDRVRSHKLIKSNIIYSLFFFSFVINERGDI